MKGTSAKALVLKTLFDRNRPLNAINITDLLGQKVPKAVVQSTLEDLSRSGHASVKVYGKSKIYWFNQVHLPQVSQRDLDETKKSIEAFMEHASSLRTKVISLEQEVETLVAAPTDAELELMVTKEQEKLDALQRRMQDISQSAALASCDAERKRKVRDKYRSEWIKRRRLCTDVVNELADAMGKKPKELQKQMSIETDEDACVLLPPAEKIAPRRGSGCSKKQYLR